MQPHVINIMKGEQFTEEFKAVNPNSKIPAIVDEGGGEGEGACRDFAGWPGWEADQCV